jgi:hypothetical protein
MSKCAVALKMSVAAVGCVLGVAANAHARAVPAQTVTFDGGNTDPALAQYFPDGGA